MHEVVTPCYVPRTEGVRDLHETIVEGAFPSSAVGLVRELVGTVNNQKFQPTP